MFESYKRKPKPVRHIDLNQVIVEAAFDREELRRICEMPEEDFGKEFGMTLTMVDQPAPADFYFFKDNGSSVLAVAHLDTVGLAHQRACNFVDTEGGLVVYSRALDDRLGAYIILVLLPALGITYDVLLTVGEEEGRSTASFFQHPEKEYDWMIEFDRGGTDVVMYQYEEDDIAQLVLDSGAEVGDGIFSDICYLEHLEVKGFNWGVGYRDYHGPRAHAYLDDTFMMVGHFLRFHAANYNQYLPHEDIYKDVDIDLDQYKGARLDDDWLNYRDLDPALVEEVDAYDQYEYATDPYDDVLDAVEECEDADMASALEYAEIKRSQR